MHGVCPGRLRLLTDHETVTMIFASEYEGLHKTVQHGPISPFSFPAVFGTVDFRETLTRALEH